MEKKISRIHTQYRSEFDGADKENKAKIQIFIFQKKFLEYPQEMEENHLKIKIYEVSVNF